jgi:hypothetical protein
MKNVAINTISYTGIVTLSKYIGDKKIQIAQFHNTGNTSLFDFLANCLAGDFTLAKVNRPTKIKLLRRRGQNISDYYYTSATPFIFLRTPPVPSSTAGESRVRFSFMIPRDIVESLSYGDASNDILGLGLYANSVEDVESESGNFMAFCSLDTLDRASLVNVFLVVDWELVITNTESR